MQKTKRNQSKRQVDNSEVDDGCFGENANLSDETPDVIRWAEDFILPPAYRVNKAFILISP